MKPFLILAFPFFLIACNQSGGKKGQVISSVIHKNTGPDTGQYINSLHDTAQLISLLYPSLEIKKTIGYCKHKENHFFKFDGTSILSIVKIPDDTNEHYAVLFKTVPYDTVGKETSFADSYMRIGLAELAKKDSQYRIVSFKEQIDSTEIDIPPVVCLERMGINEYAIGITYRFAMGAIDDKMENFYQIPGCAKIFSYQPQVLRDVFIFNDMPEEETYRTLSRMYTFLPYFLSPKYYDLYITIRTIKYNSKKNREIETVKSEYYRMDESKNVYVKDSLL